MIRFIEHNSDSYAPRTIENARNSDLTIAFAENFNTRGEELTKKWARRYRCVSLLDFSLDPERIKRLSFSIGNDIKSINIAGNGIYSLSQSQSHYDGFISDMLTDLFYMCGCEWASVISGGQTGIDESGLKWGSKFGLDTFCLAPKGWKFRGKDGKDVSDKEKFLSRFNGHEIVF